MARHAHALEDKLARRKVILAAARRLFVAGGGELPSAADIAAEAQLAKGTIYLYFKTREEIFCELLVEMWLDLMAEVDATFRDAKGTRAAKIEAHLDLMTRHLANRPEVLRLDALGYSLQQNVDPAKRHEQNRRFVARLAQAGATIDRTLRLEAGRGVRVLMRSYALTRGVWQATHQQAGAPFEADLALSAIFPDFAEELREALTEYWRGAVAPGRPAPGR